MLSPAELFAVRSRQQNLPQRSHGQKDFLPDGSEVQDTKLQICRAEQWELLGEERVERLGSLGRGVWKPEEELVELTLPAGKFWHTMGFTKAGRQCLLPEEALYLLECGSVRLFFEDLPLSVQDAYQKLLSHGPVTLLHYQVYSHLKRLGYIVTRFDPSSVRTSYERQLKLDVVGSRKRKRSSSPRKAQPRENEAPPSIAPARQSGQPAGEDDHQSDVKSPSRSSRAESVTFPSSSRWDFSKIQFPNCAPDRPRVTLRDPSPTLLPQNVSGRPADASRWLTKLNLRSERTSRREQEQWEWERKYKTSVNANPKVRKCANWEQYKKLLREKTRHNQRPPNLWRDIVHPLLVPGAHQSTASVLEEITVMSQTCLLDDSKRIQMPNSPQIHFNLYQADGTSTFRKSKPGEPYARLCVRSFDERTPSLLELKVLTDQSGDVPVVFALVDFGEVAFYTFRDFQLPVDVYP